MSDVETVPLRRIGREIEAVHRDLKELEQLHGAGSPQVISVLSDMATRLAAQPGNERFVKALHDRIIRLQTA